MDGKNDRKRKKRMRGEQKNWDGAVDDEQK